MEVYKHKIALSMRSRYRKILNISEYKLNRPEQIDTPAMITYKHIVNQNISEIISLSGGSDRIVPHAKTHKSSDVLEMQINAGIKSFKCATLKDWIG